MDIKNIGNFLKDLRLEHGMSQDELSEKLFVSRQAISNWEVGKSVPDYDCLLKLSDLYNIKVEEILRGKIIYKNKIYRFFTNVFSEKSKKIKFIYITIVIILFLFIGYMSVYFFNTYGKIKFYDFGSDINSEVSCLSGFLVVSPDTVHFKNCKINGVDNMIVKKVKYYYLYEGNERIIDMRENNNGLDMNFRNGNLLRDYYDYGEYFDYKNLDKYIDDIYVDIETNKGNYKLKLDFYSSYSTNRFWE